jgi:hypothetical protein
MLGSADAFSAVAPLVGPDGRRRSTGSVSTKPAASTRLLPRIARLVLEDHGAGLRSARWPRLRQCWSYVLAWSVARPSERTENRVGERHHEQSGGRATRLRAEKCSAETSRRRGGRWSQAWLQRLGEGAGAVGMRQYHAVLVPDQPVARTIQRGQPPCASWLTYRDPSGPALGKPNPSSSPPTTTKSSRGGGGIDRTRHGRGGLRPAQRDTSTSVRDTSTCNTLPLRSGGPGCIPAPSSLSHVTRCPPESAGTTLRLDRSRGPEWARRRTFSPVDRGGPVSAS